MTELVTTTSNLNRHALEIPVVSFFCLVLVCFSEPKQRFFKSVVLGFLVTMGVDDYHLLKATHYFQQLD